MQQHLSLNPFASEFSSSDAWPNTMPMEFYEALHKQNRLIELLVEQQHRSLLPTLTLSEFTSDPLEFHLHAVLHCRNHKYKQNSVQMLHPYRT